MREPLVSVVMPVFNGGRYLLDAVASIVLQTFSDWELICVNDGSHDGSSAVLDWCATQDARIRVIHQAKSGIVAALNIGCREARAPLICRMDCDDIAMPERLAAQVSFMRRHPECVVVGGAILEIDADGDPLNESRLAPSHADIVSNLLQRRTGHFHPTTLIRAEALRAVSGYRQEYQWVEDHDLWLRLAQRGQLSNLSEVVLCYRQHASSVCWQRSAQQRELMNTLLRDAYRARGLDLPGELIVDSTTSRSTAGPGKWARAAAKGGYVRSTFKHLARLNQSNATKAYKFRMNLEALSRLTLACLDRALRLCRQPTIPTFASWHEKYEETDHRKVRAA